MYRSRSATDTQERLETGERPETGAENAEEFVEFRIPADPAYVRVARLAAGDMAERAGFSLDELDDVRLAVDELCAILISAGGSDLRLRFQVRDRTLIISGRTLDARAPAQPSQFSEMLLRALVDTCSFATHAREMSFETRKLARDIT